MERIQLGDAKQRDDSCLWAGPSTKVHNLKLMNYFWNFPSNIFRLRLTMGN